MDNVVVCFFLNSIWFSYLIIFVNEVGLVHVLVQFLDFLIIIFFYQVGLLVFILV
jgi:hypothetical protein